MRRVFDICILMVLFSCQSKNVKKEFLDSVKQQVIWNLEEDKNIENYKSLSFERIDSQFLTIDEEWELIFYYLDERKGDTLKWTYEDLLYYSKIEDFKTSYVFIRQEQKLINTLYYGMGFKVLHQYIDSVGLDTFKIELLVDTNLNIKKKRYYN